MLLLIIYVLIAADPPKRVRGKAKNEKLRRMVKAGGPVSMTFERDVTFTPVGEVRDMFSREAGTFMWNYIPLDKVGWDNVEQPYKEALMNHMKANKLYAYNLPPFKGRLQPFHGSLDLIYNNILTF